MNLVRWCDRIIEYSFYSLFILVPLVLAGDTSELFEFNKMWTAFALGIVIAVVWASKSILEGRTKIQRTPLDIPIALFFLSQFLSTLFSWDQHVSFWGYYSRWNGGFLSTILYIFLYYAFVSNLLKQYGDEKNNLNFKIVKRILGISLGAGILVSLWGIPSHFSLDPTCLLFRGHLDVACWADDFQPRVRIFSTLGQPDWLAAYMAILIPVSVALFIDSLKENVKKKFRLARLSISYPTKIKLQSFFYFISFTLFNISLLYSRSRSGILAVWFSFIVIFAGYYILNRKKQLDFFTPTILAIILLVCTFFIGAPFGFTQKFSYSSFKNIFAVKSAPAKPAPAPTAAKPAPLHSGELGGTDSSTIRLLVWKGAINAWKDNPLFGTGVETFAFAYYKYKLPGHNQTSEWNFLYNKAHNEFLNLLATTGLLGLGTYLAMNALFFYKSIKKLLKDKNNPNALLVLALISSYVTILITNFFGFSVVIVNIYLFLIPAFGFVILNLINTQKVALFPKLSEPKKIEKASIFQWAGIVVVVTLAIYFLYNLLIFWNADKAYGYGSNLDRVSYFQDAYPYLQKAVAGRPGEPVFEDELSINNAALATQLISQTAGSDKATESAQTAEALSQNAIKISDKLVTSYPKNFVFWKTRVRIFYTLSQISSNMLVQALDAVRHAQELAPNDASINFNLGVIEGQNGNIDKAIQALERTVKMKPDYRDSRYALGLFYYQKAVDKDDKVVDRSYVEKAKTQMKYILEHIASTDTQVKEALKTLEEK